jgi:hypothetical protein
MRDQYRLVGVGNSELLAGLSELVRQSNGLTARVLAHLVEIEARMLHLELGHSSLFAYCVEALGMSEGTAGRRVTATRVCRRFPEAFDRVARGWLHLCALCALAPHLNAENATELFEACKGKTRRQIEESLAARFPRPDVREQIRRLPRRAARQGIAVGQPSQSTPIRDELILAPISLAPIPLTPTAPASTPLASTPLASTPLASTPLASTPLASTPLASTPLASTPLASTPLASTPLASTPLASMQPAPMPLAPVGPGMPATQPHPAPLPVTEARHRVRELKPLSPERFGVHFTADAELRDLIERARALARHRLPNGELASLMKLVVASFVRHEEKRRFGIGARPQGTRKDKGAETNAKDKGAETKAKLARTAEQGTPPGGVPMAIGDTEATPRGTGAGRDGKRGRYVPVAVRREAHDRDGGQCAFVSTDGRRCTARALLEFDHVKPFARFGAHEVENVRLLCKAHNLLHARRCFGVVHLAARIAATRRLHPEAPSIAR